MINLENFFKNHFDSTRISDDNFNKFTSDHLERLSNNGGYPALVAALTAAYGTWSGATLSEATNEAIKQGYTKAVNLAVDAIKKAISQQEGTVRGKYAKSSPAYQEFFPLGVTEYTTATLANIKEKLERFINAATAHVADLGAPFVAQFTALHNSFDSARNAQLGGKGAVSTHKSTSTTTRDTVETQLMVNVLNIALDHIGDPQGGLAFFDKSILESKQPAKPKTPPKP